MFCKIFLHPRVPVVKCLHGEAHRGTATGQVPLCIAQISQPHILTPLSSTQLRGKYRKQGPRMGSRRPLRRSDDSGLLAEKRELKPAPSRGFWPVNMGRGDASIQVQAPVGTEEYAVILIAGVLRACMFYHKSASAGEGEGYILYHRRPEALPAVGPTLTAEQRSGVDTYNLTCCKEI